MYIQEVLYNVKMFVKVINWSFYKDSIILQEESA